MCGHGITIALPWAHYQVLHQTPCDVGRPVNVRSVVTVVPWLEPPGSSLSGGREDDELRSKYLCKVSFLWSCKYSGSVCSVSRTIARVKLEQHSHVLKHSYCKKWIHNGDVVSFYSSQYCLWISTKFGTGGFYSLPWTLKQYVCPKYWYVCTPQGTTTRKTITLLNYMFFSYCLKTSNYFWNTTHICC
jgi:hypothetical protein